VRTEDFPSVLASFLHDGKKLLAYHIPLILLKLSALARIVYRLKGFRFYGCSLLFIYDGDEAVQEGYHQVIAETATARTSKYPSLKRKSRARSEEREGSSERVAHVPRNVKVPAGLFDVHNLRTSLLVL